MSARRRRGTPAPQGGGVDPDDQSGPGGVYLGGQGGRILELAEEVGLLDIDAGGGLIQQSGGIGDAVFRRAAATSVPAPKL